VTVLAVSITKIYSQFGKCSSYTCNNNLGSNCFEATATAAFDSYNNTIYNYLVNNQCVGNTHCAVNDDTAPLPTVVGSVTNFTCVNNFVTPASLVDAENCSIDADCYTGVCDSTKKTCTGLALGTACTNTNACVTGSFCELSGLPGNGTCIAQKAVGQNCTLSTDCINTAGCLNSTCFTYFSLPPTTNIGPVASEYLCSTGNVDDATNLCITLVSQTSEVRCINTTCSYTIQETNATITSSDFCFCGVSNDGYTVCQYANGVQSQAYYDLYMSFRNRGCHTNKRTSCNNLITAQDRTNIDEAYYTYLGLFRWGPVDSCINNFYTLVTSSSSFVGFSYAFVALIAAFLF